MKYWQNRKKVEGNFLNFHLTYFFIIHFDLNFDYQNDKKYERKANGLYDSIKQGIKYDFSDHSFRIWHFSCKKNF